jgi:hypothetical protein
MLDRRRFLAAFSGMGLSSTLLPGVLWALADGKTEITEAMIEQAAAIADVPIPAEYHKTMLESLNDHAKNFEEIYKLHIPNSVAPALLFDPVLPSAKFETQSGRLRFQWRRRSRRGEYRRTWMTCALHRRASWRSWFARRKFRRWR